MQKLTLLLSMALALAPGGFARAFDAPMACKVQVLRELGWSTRAASAPSLQVSGVSCKKSNSLDSAHGSLTLTGTSADEAVLDSALQNTVSLCGYSQLFDQSLQTAGKNLQHDFMYWFDMPVLGSGIVRMGALNGWQRVACTDEDKCFMPVEGHFEDAFHSLYHGRYASECATGLQITEYSAIHELFGERMGSYFKPEELFVGNWGDIGNSSSVTHGRVGRRFADASGKAYGKLGAEMMVGLTGYIGSLYPSQYLDSPVNRNENFVLMSTSDEAAAEVARNGFSFYTQLMKKIWSESRAFSPEEMQQIGAGKTVARDVAGSRLMIDQLNDPFFRDTILRVHPSGNWPIAKHILRLIRINPRTPYGFAIYPEAVHAEIFDRWVRSQLDSCSEQSSLTPIHKESL